MFYHSFPFLAIILQLMYFALIISIQFSSFKNFIIIIIIIFVFDPTYLTGVLAFIETFMLVLMMTIIITTVILYFKLFLFYQGFQQIYLSLLLI